MRTWTTDQEKAINSVDCNLIVSASAGAGKTSAMVERALTLVAGKRIPVEKIMLLTYSNNSAGEMKERLRQGMINYAKEHPEDADYIREQLDDLSQADISTIHGFCFKLVREFFEVVGLSPSVGISPDDESVINRAKAMENALKRCEKDEDISKLMSKLSLRKDNDFTAAIERFYDYMTAQPDRKKWLESCVESYSSDKDFEKSVISEFLAKYFSDAAKIYAAKLREYIRIAKDINADKIITFAIKNLDFIQCYEGVSNIRELYRAYDEVRNNEKPRKPTKSEDVVLLERVNDLRSEFFKKYVDKLAELFPKDVRYEELVFNRTEAGKQVEQLVKAVKFFEEEYDAIKYEQNVIDFNDMERYTVEILSDSTIAEEIRNRHEYVFVDEFQDTNYVEYFIISAVTKPDRLFVVGDVKQSIYRFRLAEPKVFLDTLEEWKKRDNAVYFKDNFRSDGRILDFVNHVFNLLMIPEFGEIDYAKDGRFSDSSKVSSEDIPVVRIIKLKANFDEKEKIEVVKDEYGVYDVTKDELFVKLDDDSEAGLIYNYIQSILGKKIKIKDKEKPIEYKDICLMYNTRGAALKTLNALSDAGIPLNISDFEENVGQKELDVFMDYVSVIDNLYDDYPLISSLHSFIGGLSNKDLARIRVYDSKSANYYSACKAYIDNFDDDLSRKLKAFFAMTDKLRFAATFTEISEFLKIVLEQTGYGTYLLSMDNGERIYSLINVFIDGIKGKKYSFDLYSLICYYKKIDGVSVKSLSDSADGVKVRTTHSSKGLEFPVVVLAGLAASRPSDSANVYTDRELGVGMKYYDEYNSRTVETVDMKAIKLKKEKDNREDKLRLFYVALTRAECALAIIMPEKDNACVYPFVEDKVSNWLNYCISSDPFVASKVVYEEPYEFDEIQKNEKVLPIEREADEKIAETVNFIYPYLSSTTTARKYSVSALNANNDKVELQSVDVEDNSFAGTAHHAVMQYIDLEARSKDAVRKELDRLLEEGLIQKEQYDAVNADEIVECLNSDIIETARKSVVYRERKFVLSKKADAVLKNGCEESILIQGVIDMLIDGDSLIVLDFKRSKLSDEKLVEKYTTQLKLYADAVEKSYGRYPDKLLLYVFGRNETIEIK